MRTKKLFLTACLLFAALHPIWAQNETLNAEPQQYNISVDGKLFKMTLFNIEENLYCTVMDFATILKGTKKEFNFTKEPLKIRERGYDLPREVYIIKGSSTLTTTNNVTAPTTTQSARSSRNYIYVDNYQRPSTPYIIAGNDYFKLIDLLRMFDIGLLMNQTERSVKIATNEYFKAQVSTFVAANSTPKKWVKVPANVGIAVNKLMGYYDADRNVILHRRLPTEYGNYIDDGVMMLTNLATLKHRYIPFDEVEFNYDNTIRNYPEGWYPVSNFYVAMGLNKEGEIVRYRGYTYINSKGEVINSSMFFTSAGQFQNGNAVVTYIENGVDFTGVIDTKGNIVMAVPGKFNSAKFYNNILQVQTVYHKDHIKDIVDVYYNVEGKRLYLEQSHYREMKNPGYNEQERAAFQQHASSYPEVQYCGQNRFVVSTKDKRTFIVNKDNKTIFEDNRLITPITTDGKLFFIFVNEGMGVKDANGNVILESKYSNIQPVNGGAFLTIIDNRAQSLVDINGKVLASSPNAPLLALQGANLITLREYLFDSEIVPGDMVMLYTNMDLSKSVSTQNLKTITGRHKYETANWQNPTIQQAQQIAQQSTANALHVFALENFLEGWISAKKHQE